KEVFSVMKLVNLLLYLATSTQEIFLDDKTDCHMYVYEPNSRVKRCIASSSHTSLPVTPSILSSFTCYSVTFVV
ncbi:hypothetical protein ACQP3J_33620, partial [Escherichia coli]